MSQIYNQRFRNDLILSKINLFIHITSRQQRFFQCLPIFDAEKQKSELFVILYYIVFI